MPGDLRLDELERVAAELAMLAGDAIQHSFSKQSTEPRARPDASIENVLWERLDELYGKPSIIGEEFGCRYSSGKEIVWVTDPIDGTDNFTQGFPIFAASIGVLHRGEPVAGAIWCSCTHVLRAGVYSGHLGGFVRFENEPITAVCSLAGKRRLAVAANLSPRITSDWAVRRSGSAAWECALLSAGVLEVVHFARPKIWDIAAGVALARTSGLNAYMRVQGSWEVLTRLRLPDLEEVGLHTQEIVIGSPKAAERMLSSID